MPNAYSWTNLTNVLWIEQPVGVGFSQGTPDTSDEIGLSRELLGFYKNFVDTFQAQYHTVHLVGESYAGFYVPYIADAMLKANDKCYYDLSGVMLIDPIVGDYGLQLEGKQSASFSIFGS